MVEFHVNSKTTTIPLGRQGENLARVIYFDLAEMIKEYGEGTATLMNKRVGDDLPYKCTTTQSGDLLAWMPNSTDTAYAGTGKCELRWVVGNVLAKSITYKATITPSITADTDLPAPYQTWYESLLAEIKEYTIASADISKNKSDIAKNKNDISTCKTNIATNTAAITALNSRLNVNVIYTDPQVTALGGINATIADAVAQKRFPENVPFSGMVQASNRYHIDGYIYPGYAYGSIWMHRYDNDVLLVSIKAGVVSVSKLPTRSEFTALEARVAALES